MRIDQVPVLYEEPRGCGFRKGGGLYLIGGTPLACGKLPIRLDKCPTCSAGLSHCRGWTWIAPDSFTSPGLHHGEEHSRACPLGARGRMGDQAGLLWVGAKFYRDPASFFQETKSQGISRRIHQIPRGFVLGETWILLAHIYAIEAPPHLLFEDGERYTPGIIGAFLPERIEYVCRGDESEQELDGLAKRGITPVRVFPATQFAPLLDGLGEPETD